MGTSTHLGSVPIAGMLFIQPGPAKAQLEQRLGAYTGVNTQGYFGPLVDAFAADLTAGFFHSAYIPKQSLSVSLELRAMSVYFSDADRTFSATTEGTFQPLTTVLVPTVVGITDPVYVDGDNGLRYVFPGGFNITSFSTAVPQLRVGSLYGTEAIFRYAYLNRGNRMLGDLRFDLYGAGLRHSVSQYLTDFPIDIAASLFYQRFHMGENGKDYHFIAANTLSLGFQVSKRIPVFESWGIGLEPYTGLSWDQFSFDAQYERDPGDRADVTFGWQNVLQLTVGMSARVAIINVSAEYNVLDAGFDVRQESVSVGVGVQYSRLKTP
jgi:hypothetical protein